MSLSDAEAPVGPDPASATTKEQKPEPESLMRLGRDVLSMLRELPRLVSDRVELLALDSHRAGLALGQIIGLTLVLAILGGTAWVLAWAGLVVGLMMAGLPDWGALLVAIGINAVAMVWVVVLIKARIPRLLLPAFRRHLSLTPLPAASLPARPPHAPAGPPSPPPPSPGAPPFVKAEIHDRSHASGSPAAT